LNTVRWGDVGQLVYGKALRNCPIESDEDNRYRVYGTNGPIGWTAEPLCPKAGIIIGRKGAYRGVHFCLDPFFVIDTAYYLRLTSPELDIKWAYYKLLTVNINLMDVGAAIPTTNRDQFHTLPLRYPALPQQIKVASILSAYDDLIENNRRRIQLLEQAARLLYKEWFVHLWFPGHEHVNIVDGVPEGWEKKELGYIAKFIMGQSPKSIYYNEDNNGLPFHQGVTNFGDRFPTHCNYCTQLNRLAEPGDILFSVRAPVGRINITLDKIIIGRGLAAIRSNIQQQNFLFYALKNYFFKDNIMGRGAIFSAITKEDLMGVKIMLPSKKLIALFMDYIKPIDLQIEYLHQTGKRLVAARDLLLPRLMNGEVKV
jgi:type I restriction enzyme, S subunit